MTSVREHWRGAAFYLGMVIVTLVVQAIEEGTSPWTIFKAIASLAILAIALALMTHEPTVDIRLRVGSWVILSAIPWAVNIVVEPAFVFPTLPAASGVPPHQAHHLFVAGAYALASLILLAFLAARPLRRGHTWTFYAVTLLALSIALGDIAATALVFRNALHFFGHLIPPALMLVGTIIAWPAHQP